MRLMYCRLQIRRSYRKASRTKQLVIELERVVTRTQEWMEGGDKLPSKAAGYGFIALTFLYMVGQAVRGLL